MKKAQFVGRLTRDVEQKEIGTTKVTSFSLAVNERVKNKDTGEYESKGEFFDFELWGDRGDILAQYAKKGDRLGVDSTPKQDTWDDKDGGGKRSKVKFRVDNFYFMGENKQEGNGNEKEENPEPVKTPAKSNPPKTTGKNNTNTNKNNKQQPEDDIPF